MQCTGKTKAGAKCTRLALKGESLCFAHSPTTAKIRKNAGRRKMNGNGHDHAAEEFATAFGHLISETVKTELRRVLREVMS